MAVFTLMTPWEVWTDSADLISFLASALHFFFCLLKSESFCAAPASNLFFPSYLHRSVSLYWGQALPHRSSFGPLGSWVT